MSIAYLLVLAVVFAASLLGPLCGIGGGVIIKPVVDALGVMDVATVSFLSSASVLTMALATLAQNAVARTSRVDARSLLPVALGSAVGGVAGKAAFGALSGLFGTADTVGAVQALVLIVLSCIVLVYTLNRAHVASLQLTDRVIQALIGAVAGALWSFLGIGGGPFNLAILAFFFAMDSKPAAQASLFIIAFSQVAGMVYSLCSGSVPAFDPLVLAGMCAMAVAGSVVGRRLAARMDTAAVDRLYVCALVLIIGVSLYNAVRFGLLAA